MRQAVTETGDLVWQKDEDGNLKPQMKRDRYGGADWVETQKAILQDMMLKEFGWERFYKGSNPRGNLLLSDYRREKAAEMAKKEERKLEDIKDKVVTGQAESIKKLTIGLVILATIIASIIFHKPTPCKSKCIVEVYVIYRIHRLRLLYLSFIGNVFFLPNCIFILRN